MTKIKEFLGWIVAGLGAVLGIVLYMLSRKGKEVDALNAKIELAKTEKQTDLIEAEINTLKAEKETSKKHNQELDKSLSKLEEKRKQIPEDAKKLTNPKEVADYWNNN